jgi:DNA replication protein DnaC
VLTTNLAGPELEGQIGARTVSRIYEMCGDPKPMFGDDQRKASLVVAMPEAAAPVADQDAFWEHGDTIRASRYGRPPGAPD